MANNGNGERPNNDWNWFDAAALGVGVAGILGGAYYLTRSSEPETNQQDTRAQAPTAKKEEQKPSVLASFCDLVSTALTLSEAEGPVTAERCKRRSPPPEFPIIRNMNALLADIYARHVALKDDEFEHHYKVFSKVFDRIHKNMKLVDDYYNRYSSNVQYAGSHYDRLKIKKPDEFDVDIVIGVPVNMRNNPNNPDESDIVIEPKWPGFVQLRAGVQYRNIPLRDGPDSHINKTAYTWLDEKNYILRSKFTDWFKGVGNKALNLFERYDSKPCVIIDGTRYTVRTSESGPAWTIIIEAPNFRVDVDLVPALKFPESRWPVGPQYRSIPYECSRDYWMVVPKPNKNGATVQDEKRSWRIALQDQEKKMFYKTEKMRTVICLLKKLRDTQNMNEIASYYIKTIFFWEMLNVSNDDFWRSNDLETLFKYMLVRFHKALSDEKIPYFWNKNHNLIGNTNKNVLNGYKSKTEKILSEIEVNYKYAARALLTDEEYRNYQRFLS